MKEDDVPLISKKEDLLVERVVILGVKSLLLYGSSLQHCFSVEEHLSGLK